VDNGNVYLLQFQQAKGALFGRRVEDAGLGAEVEQIKIRGHLLRQKSIHFKHEAVIQGGDQQDVLHPVRHHFF